MSCAENLQRVLEKLLISDQNRAVYTKDAEEIQNFVIQELKQVDDTFRKVFDGLSLGGSYLDRVKLNTPDEFDMHMKLKFPLNICPKRDQGAFIFLNVPFIVADCGRIHRMKLQTWLRDAFHKVFQSSVQTFTSSSRQTYTLRYTLEGYGCAHTIEAVSAARTIKFDLVPAFEFTGDQWPLPDPPVTDKVRQEWPWFAVPQTKPKSKAATNFMAIAPHWEREMMKNSDNLKNVLRLMKGLRDAHVAKLPHLSSYMLKTVLLHQLAKVDWQRDLGTLLLEMWGHLVDHLEDGQLPYYLANEHNILTRMNEGQLRKCRAGSQDLLRKLKMLKPNGSYLEFSILFGVN